MQCAMIVCHWSAHPPRAYTVLGERDEEPFTCSTVRTAKWQEEGHVPSLIVSRLGAVSDSALRRNERQIHHRNSNWTPVHPVRARGSFVVPKSLAIYGVYSLITPDLTDETQADVFSPGVVSPAIRCSIVPLSTWYLPVSSHSPRLGSAMCEPWPPPPHVIIKLGPMPARRLRALNIYD
ncbi:hypothetical protein BGY98DRAFT_976779 [Russula aff. rugulosa BPL654]|nr:hypothetical protein BGY98DRAFT_976779 [Russula aff. rugulosa BPL654]